MSEQNWQRADAHIHLFKGGYHAEYGGGWARENELECYDALRQKHQIARALIVGFEGAPQFAGNNRNLASWGKKHSWMAPLCYVNCQRIPSATTLRDPFVGLALYINTEDDIDKLTKWPPRFYEVFNSRQAIISINTTPQMLQKLAPFVARMENCPILISHLGLPGRFVKSPGKRLTAAALDPLLALAKFRNVNVKISGLYAISDPAYDFPHRSASPLLRGIYDAFGPRRLMWGSDFSPCLEHISFVQAVQALEILNEVNLGWPEKEMQQIRGGNLLRLLGK
jgi:predicted TIM-barrel fold metal-dependent hydrolase